MTLTIVVQRKQPTNPFYVLLVIAGVAFTITACAYALMMVRAARPAQPELSQASAAPGEESGLMKLLDERGMEILGVEILILALATVGAIGLDQWRVGHEQEIAEASANGGLEQLPRRGQTVVAGSEAAGTVHRQTFDPERVRPNAGSTPSGSAHNVEP